MNKAELIDFISEEAKLSKAEAQRALEAYEKGVLDSLQKGEPVVQTNFGTYTVKERAARQGHIPSTGEKITIKATRVVSFKAGKGLKEAVKVD